MMRQIRKTAHTTQWACVAASAVTANKAVDMQKPGQ
jgi:hypothetical protein